MDFLDFWELAYDQAETVVKVLLCVFNLSHVKITDPRYLVTTMNYRWRFSLCLGENDISEILARRHHRNSLKIILVRHREELITMFSCLNYYTFDLIFVDRF